MIGHDVQSLDLYREGLGFLAQQLVQARRNRARQHRLAIFRTPDEMQVQVEHAPRVLPVARRTHVLKYTRTLDSRQLSTQEKGGRGRFPRPGTRLR